MAEEEGGSLGKADELAADSTEVPAEVEEKLRQLVIDQLSEDLRLNVMVDEDGICGGAERAYLLNVELRTWERVGQFEWDPKWELLKTYGVLESEVMEQDSPSLMDSETCAE